MQWFKVPEKIYFEPGSIQYLSKMKNISRAFIVTDKSMVDLGYVDKILYHLRKREDYVHSRVYDEVEPDPSFETIMKGVRAMEDFKPDVIIALGGGSAIDAAKGMWLFYEHPDADIKAMSLKFMDIRKKTYKFPELGKKAKLVAIPTTSGTGSEVTAFAVLSDKVNNMKYPFTDYEMTPDIAIVDPELVMTLPKGLVADCGMDVLAHALEAYISVMASDYTDALAEKVVEMVFNYLPQSYNGENLQISREKMHNASCMAGMAFSNAFLGICHSTAHKLGAEFHLPHGRLISIMLPYVIKYNTQEPTKFVSWPKYEYFIADKKIASIARRVGVQADNDYDLIKGFVYKIKELSSGVGEPQSLRDAGVDEGEFLSLVDSLADKAFGDQCTQSNPRVPLVSEMKQLLLDAYYGNELY